MLRIPNPGSNLDQLIRIFQDLHPYLKGMPTFDLDDITKAMIAKNNVTSQGAIGAEALRRSKRKDRSLDALYNQSKMYSELYRALGWMHSTDGSLTFRFTALGHHLASAVDPSALARECFLGIAFPNEVLGVKGNQSTRVFATILLTLAELGSLSRDEIIAGPMSILDDTLPTKIEEMIGELRRMREAPGALNKRLNDISTARGIKRGSTMANYTRIPMAFFPWAGWAVKATRGSLLVTKEGIEAATKLRAIRDFRLRDFLEAPDAVKEALITSANYRVLERGGFDVGTVAGVLQEAERTLVEAGIVGPLNFSPFQQLSYKTIKKYADGMLVTDGVDEEEALLANVEVIPEHQRGDPIIMLMETTKSTTAILDRAKICQQLLLDRLAYEGGQDELVVDYFLREFEKTNQDRFYPFVADLLTVIGFDCRLSRRGVNNAREDALIVDPTHCIPVEIKSPGEEMEISVKGVRQALENKIILLARTGNPYPTTPDSTSLVVGFNPPNDRSEVHELVEDIKVTFGINIGIIDFRTLLRLAINRVRLQTSLSLVGVTTLRGILRVEVAQPDA